MKRQAINYVANCIVDIRKGVNQLESASRIETVDNVRLRIKELKHELELMDETIMVIHNQTELEV